MTEEWKIISVNKNYEVSDQGRVRRIGKRILKLKSINTGYHVVSLSSESIVKSFTVHRLVCVAFHGQPEESQVVNHKDGDKKNNKADNLEWTTYSENNSHALRMGLRNNPDTRGESNGRSKLTAKDVIEILGNPDRLTGVALAKKFGVSPQSISLIKQRKAWASAVDNSLGEPNKPSLPPRALFAPSDQQKGQ